MSCISPIIISKNILTKNEERGIVLFLNQNGGLNPLQKSGVATF